MSFILASATALASVPAVLAPLVASIVLLITRSVAGAAALPLSRRVSLLLDLSIAVLGVLFLAFVLIRFRALG